MKFALATAAAALLTATTAFAAGVEGQGPAEGLNIAPTTGQTVAITLDGPLGESGDSFVAGETKEVTVFDAQTQTKSGGAYYR